MQDRAGMEGPGLSLFQGSDDIQLNTSNQRRQEEEEQEDVKRRNQELKDLLTNAFDDLEDDDDLSSVNSSHYHETAREPDSSGVIDNSVERPTADDKGPSIADQFEKEFRVYGRDQSRGYDENLGPNETELQKGSTISDIRREYGLFQTGVTSPYANNNKEHSVDSPYELPRLPNPGFLREFRSETNEDYSLRDNYPFHYETPSNHYDGKGNSYGNNGYDEPFENNVENKEYDGVGVGGVGGGGDVNDVSSEHYNHCYKTSPNGRPVNDNNAYKAAEYNSKEQLEVLYSVRMREIHRLTEELERSQLEKDQEKNRLGRKLALAQAEIERSNLSRNQAQNALVDAKAEIADLQNQVKSLKEDVGVLEKTNQNLEQELTVARDSIMDLQQKIAVLERVQTLRASDKTQEKFLKQAQEKHATEMRNMQTQIDVLTEKLDAKESSYVDLGHKLSDARRAHEIVMVEKADTVNRLSQALENSQAQCQKLMASNKGQESMQLQARVKMLTQENEELQKNFRELEKKLEMAKNDAMQYDSLLATSLEDETDSIRQLKLGDQQQHSKLRNKNADDIANKLRGELQRCLAGQAVKRKEINRLENTLAQKDKELGKAMEMAATCQQEAARYAKRVNELEQDLKAVLTEHTVNANAQIQKLSDHLTEVKTHYEELREEKLVLEQKLEETLMNQQQQETMNKLNGESLAQQEKEIIDDYNKEYLEIHEKAVARVRQEAHLESVQLTVQLEQTQKELDRVKELYIDVCGTKEQLMSDHKNEMRILKEQYANTELEKQNMDKMRVDLEAQTKIVERLTVECESYKMKIVELEKDLSYEKKKKEEYTKKIHDEIEKAKEEALTELRNAHPNHRISLSMPDHCSEHSEKILRLEKDCKRLEEKLSAAVDEERNALDVQTELDETRLKLARMEIAEESLKKKYNSCASERNELSLRITSLEREIKDMRIDKRENSEDVCRKIVRLQSDNETMRKKCEILMKDKSEQKEIIKKLTIEIGDKKNIITDYENIIGKASGSIADKEELKGYNDLVEQLSSKLNERKDKTTSDLFLEKRVHQLEIDLRDKENKLDKLKDLEKIKKERDELVMKLKNQAMQFEQYVRNQKQVSRELNFSPRSSTDVDVDLEKLRETTMKQVREQMEQKVADELRIIEDQNREKQKTIEERYKTALLELHSRCNDKTKQVESMREAMNAEKIKLHSSFKAQEKIVTEMIEAKLECFNKELLARKLKIEELQEQLRRKEIEAEDERNVMAQVMSDWTAEIREIKANEDKMNVEIARLKQIEKSLINQINAIKDKEEQTKISNTALKHKYQCARKSAQDYKQLERKTRIFMLSEQKRIEESYERAMKQAEEKIEALISSGKEQIDDKLKEVENEYHERLEQMRLKMKYKSKS